MAGPTLDDVTNAQCPDSLPYKCLPYGVCYNHESYCSPKSRTVEPCFPLDLLHKDAELFSWCHKFIQGQDLHLPDQSCLFACFHRFNASKLLDSAQNALVITRLQTEVVVMISVLINWMVCGTILLVLVTYCKRFRSYLITTRNPQFWKLPANKRGHMARMQIRRAEEDSNTELAEGIELRPVNSCVSSNEHTRASPQKPSKTEDEASEIATVKFQVVLNECDINIKSIPALQLQTRQADDPTDQLFPTAPNSPGAFTECDDSEDERNLMDDVDLSRVLSQRMCARDEHVWHD